MPPSCTHPSSQPSPRSRCSALVAAFLACTAAAMMTATATAQTPAFPGAEGYGSIASGGRGGDVYVVTNLNASGSGSFADAVRTAPESGRTIVFAVSGHIRLPSGSGGGLSIAGSKITVAGQTAPGDGICFWNNTMNLTGDDLIISNIRCRFGKQAAGGDAVDISGSQRLILDHCEVMFSTDENLSSFGTPPEFFTFQWSLNAWGLQSHSAGGLWDIDHATAHHTLWANNHTRNPKCIGPSVFDWANNVVFGWDIGFNMAPNQTGGTGFINRVNIRGSTFSHGANTGDVIYGGGNNDDGSRKFKLHTSDSALDGNNNGVLDVSKANYAMVSSGTTYDAVATAWPQTVDGVATSSLVGMPVTLDERLTAYKKVLSQGGAVRMEYDAARPLRDEISQLCVTRAATMQRGIISDPLELGLSTGTAFASLKSAAAPVDTDLDGMPNFWEIALGMNASVQSHNTLFPSTAGILTGSTFFPENTSGGFTHLEEYLHFKSAPHATLPRNTLASPSFLEIDLSRYTSGFTNSPAFVLSSISGGTATQSGTGGKIVLFTPTLNTAGRARFDFTVTDAEGDSWTQAFCLLVSTASVPRDLRWVGNGTTNPWDTTTSSVWSRSGNVTAFNHGDFVSLDDTGSAAPALTLNGTLQPGAVLVDTTTKAYTLVGPGSLGGTASLTKRGKATLTLRTNNTYTGGTTLEEGALVLGLVGTAVNAAGNVGSGTLTLLSDSTLTNAWVGTQLPLAAPISVPAGSQPTLYTGRNLRFSGALSGDGILTLVNQTVPGNTFELTGPWADFAGTLRINYAGTNSGIRTIFNGGTFNGLPASRLEIGGGNSINPVTNSTGNTFAIGALSSPAANAVLTGGTSGPPNYTIGELNTSTTFAGQFTGNAKLTKVGTGTLTLTGNSTHTGVTTVNAGTLMVEGNFGTSPVSVATGARIGGGGMIGGTVNVASGGYLEPQGTLTTGALTLVTTTLRFDISATPNGANDRIQAASATLSGQHTVEISLKDGTLGAGVYPLISTSGGFSATGASYVLNLSNTPRQTFIVQATATALQLVVTGSPTTLAWSGKQTLWDVGTTAAWLNGATADTFLNADAVSFTDAATAGSVTLAAAVAPRSILVNNASRAFTFTGSSINGGGILTKSGTGTLTLSAANAFTGGTRLEAGNLQLGNNASSLGSGTVTMNGGVLKMFSAGNTTSAGTLPNSLQVTGNARLEVAPRCVFSGDVIGSGTLDYRTNYVRADVTGDWSAFSGQLNITTTSSGDFRIASAYGWPGLPNATVNLASATFFYMSGTLNTGASTTISIGALSGASGSHLRGGATAARTLTYRIGGLGTTATFSGDVTEQNASTTTSLVKTGTGTWNLGGPLTHRGDTVVETGTLCLLASASLTSAASLDVRSGASLCLNGGNVSVESISIAEGATLQYSGGTLTGETSLGGTLSVSLNLPPIPSGQSVTICQNTSTTPVSGTFAEKPEGSLISTNSQSLRLSYRGGDGNDVTLTALTALETWRLTHLGLGNATNTATDLLDTNGDGEVNLLEFATGQSPHAKTLATPTLSKTGANLEFTYTRSKAALSDGLTFTIERRPDLPTGIWSNTGVSEQILNDNGTLQTVKATLTNGGATNRQFIHLKITRP